MGDIISLFLCINNFRLPFHLFFVEERIRWWMGKRRDFYVTFFLQSGWISLGTYHKGINSCNQNASFMMGDADETRITINPNGY